MPYALTVAELEYATAGRSYEMVSVVFGILSYGCGIAVSLCREGCGSRFIIKVGPCAVVQIHCSSETFHRAVVLVTAGHEKTIAGETQTVAVVVQRAVVVYSGRNEGDCTCFGVKLVCLQAVVSVARP